MPLSVATCPEGRRGDLSNLVADGPFTTYLRLYPLFDRVYVERGVSSSKPVGERQEGSRLLEACQPGDAVITPKLDRMFRSSLAALNVASLDNLVGTRIAGGIVSPSAAAVFRLTTSSN